MRECVAEKKSEAIKGSPRETLGIWDVLKVKRFEFHEILFGAVLVNFHAELPIVNIYETFPADV